MEISRSTDVLIVGSGPIGATFARLILEKHDSARVLMVEVGAQTNAVIGRHHGNDVKYQKDIDAFIHVIQGALQPISIPPNDTFMSTLHGDAWTDEEHHDDAPLISVPPKDGRSIRSPRNPNQNPRRNLRASAITRTVGGMATHWTCACPQPHDDEIKESPLRRELRIREEDGTIATESLLARAENLLNVHDDQFKGIRQDLIIKELNKRIEEGRIAGCLPLAAQRCTVNENLDNENLVNKNLVTWTGIDTILGDFIHRKTEDGEPRFELLSETLVSQLEWSRPTGPTDSMACAPIPVGAAQVRELRSGRTYCISAKHFVIACGAVCTPQLLWNSEIRPDPLGRYLAEKSLSFCQVVLRRSLIDKISTGEQYAQLYQAHCDEHPRDNLPIPHDDHQPHVMIPYSNRFQHHAQIQRGADSYGEIGPRADVRVVVDVRFFGRMGVRRENCVTFSREDEFRNENTDLYGMPQATFNVRRSQEDETRDHKMMSDMCNVSNVLGAFLPGSYPQFMEPGLSLHITGTTRIGNDSATSVADKSSRVHGFSNLWVGGNGCIPDSTACNPTLTSVAYAIYSAEALVRTMRENNQ